MTETAIYVLCGTALILATVMLVVLIVSLKARRRGTTARGQHAPGDIEMMAERISAELLAHEKDKEEMEKEQRELQLDAQVKLWNRMSEMNREYAEKNRNL